MTISDQQRKSIKKYREKNTDIRFGVTKEEKEKLKDFCAEHGQSLSSFAKEAFYEKMESIIHGKA